jgi:hypothetical protein
MPLTIPTADDHADLREAMRDLCSRYDDAYWRKVDDERGYPEEFIDALTKAGWLAAMIPEEYGGSGLGLTEATIVMEEINRSGGNAGALPRPDVQHGDAPPARLGGTEAPLPAADRFRRAPPPVDGGDRADDRDRHDQAQDHRGPEGRPLRRQRPEGVDLPHPALRPDDSPRPHYAARRGEEEVGRPVGLPRRPQVRRSATASPPSRSATWSITRPTSCSSTISRFRRRTSSARRARGSATSSTASTPSAP